jgi:hypothetical protein
MRLWLAVVVAGLLAAPVRLSAKETASPTTSAAAAATPIGPCDTKLAKCPPRLHDEVWVVSSRSLGCPGNETGPPQLEAWQLDLNNHTWNSSSQDAFLAASDPTMPTVFWVHGNWKDAGTAREEGLEVYQQLTNCAADRPIRFVIFSWPANRTRGLREDARRKYYRTNFDSYYLASLVSQINPKVPVDFVGFSFGAKVVTGALHVLGGGTLAGHALPQPMAARAPMQAVPICAAVNNDALAVGRSNGQALPVVSRMLALNNGCDRALKHYSAVDPCSRPQALGYTGAVGPLGASASKLREVDLCCAVGKEHYWGAYFYNPSIVARMRPYLGLAD